MEGRKAKRNFIYISESDQDSEQEQDESSSSSSSSSDDDSEWSSEEEEPDFDSVEEEDEDDEDDDDDQDSESKISPLNEQERYNRVIDLLKGRRDLQTLKLEECKAYLRKHGLRLTGTKEICLQRIQEHSRIKDGNGEKLYPRSSFTINCTGDVCKGDVVVFTQRIYAKFNKVTRNGNPLGKRVIAGRIVKDSYGAAKQQHTFTVEVLWSKGGKKLPPLFPLLVKGRNLYRLKTFRQRWDNEAKRSEVLAEKHKRGTAARHFRAMKKARSANGGAKHRSSSHQTRPSPKRHRNEVFPPATKADTRKNGGGHGKAPVSGQAKVKRVAKQRAPKTSSPRQFQPISSKQNIFPVLHSYTRNGPPNYHYGTQQHFHHPRDISSMIQSERRSFNFSNEVASTSTSMPYTNSTVIPRSQPQGYGHTNCMHHVNTNYGYQFDPRNLKRMDRQLHPVPYRTEERHGGLDKGFWRCSRPGCLELRDENCVVCSCLRCCRGTGTRCLSVTAKSSVT